jgi:hypothetical protein
VGENRQAKGEIENENVQPEPANSRLRQQVDEKNSAQPDGKSENEELFINRGLLLLPASWTQSQDRSIEGLSFFEEGPGNICRGTTTIASQIDRFTRNRGSSRGTTFEFSCAAFPAMNSIVIVLSPAVCALLHDFGFRRFRLGLEGIYRFLICRTGFGNMRPAGEPDFAGQGGG